MFDASDLSRQQSAILSALAQGQTLKDIAASMGISYATARVHCHRASVKLGAHTTAQMLVIAAKHGLV